MPVAVLLDNPAAGVSVGEAVDEFGVTREQVTGLMGFVACSLDKPPSFDP